MSTFAPLDFGGLSLLLLLLTSFETLHTTIEWRVSLNSMTFQTREFTEPVVYLVISASTVAGKARFPRLNADGTVSGTPANEVLTRFGFPPALFSIEKSKAT
jgi:hypothetical protein